MACNMWFSTALFVVLLYVVVASKEVQGKSPILSYWHRKLPTTPIPDALQQLIFPNSSHNTSDLLDAIREGDSALTPKLGRKGGPDVDAVRKYPSYYGYYYEAVADEDDMISNLSWSAMFFLEEEFHTGKRLTLYKKPLKKSSAESGIFFLPRYLAEAIPFSSDKLSVALQMLNISKGSHTALAMKHTLQVCESPANGAEIRYCATSLESMIDQVTSTLGTTRVSVLETNVPCNLNSQRYTITGIPFQSKSGLESVICHGERYPYAVYYCHQAQHITAARVSLEGDDGSIGEGVTVCHSDTSAWNADYFVFKLLNVKPGTAPICHLLPAGHVLWLRAN